MQEFYLQWSILYCGIASFTLRRHIVLFVIFDLHTVIMLDISLLNVSKEYM